MIELYKLSNQIKHYAWGSPNFIPHLLCTASDGQPWAELWMGCHPGAPSQVILPSEPAGGLISLGELIAADPFRYLGKETAQKYAALPFLFKLLAAEKPLSIQAHPNLTQAQEGFSRENSAGLPVDAPNRNYKDPNHKPEIICALTPFTGMCGFRSPDVIKELLTQFVSQRHSGTELTEGISSLMRVLETPRESHSSTEAQREEGQLQEFLSSLFAMPRGIREALTEYILTIPVNEDTSLEYRLMQEFARLYPGDPAVISPLYLNVFNLEPGEAIFLQAGVLHAYCSGFGVELMANSDNVLRGGLTGKHIDIPELMHVLDFTPMTPQIIKPVPGTVPNMESGSCFTYPAPCDEFSLTRINSTGVTVPWRTEGPAIGIVTEGEVNAGGMILKQGESVFIPPGEKLLLQGNFTLYAASIGSAASCGSTASV